MKHPISLLSFLLAGSALISGMVQAAAAAHAPEESTVETVIVTGTREAGRTVFESQAPVDVIGGDVMQKTVSNETIDKIAALVPSFNVQRLPMADGQVFVRPATIRGLSPDETLVLINGKRQHRSAFLGDNGAQGVDMNQIPSFAIGHIEVLRDGAAAQYGSDAIAGVINIILDQDPGLQGFGEVSKYYDGDGLKWQAGAKGGYSFGSGNFIIGTVQWDNAAPTSRSVQRPDAETFQEENPDIDVADPVEAWGQPATKSWRGALNSQFNLGDGMQAYGFATVNRGFGKSDFNWRNPTSSSAYGTSSAYPDYDLSEIYPAGFTPRFSQKDLDYSGYAGIRGGDLLTWDFSVSFGRNEIAYYIGHTINASLGTDSPTYFYLGTLSQQEFNQNADFVYPLNTGLFYGPINIAFGAEHRQETYGIAAGEKASYETGDGAVDGLPSGANGFPGYSDENAGEWSSQSYAGYVDVEMPITRRWSTGFAGRYESFSDFGHSLNGKVSTRYEINDDIAFRASYSTGFRAPTPGQVHSTRTSQGLDTETLELYTTGRLSPTSEVAQYFGGKALRPELSHNVSAGFAFDFHNGFSGSVDAYQINLDHRFGTSDTYTVTDDIRAELEAEGVSGADSITQVDFYTNAYDTRTQGVDIVGTYVTDLYAGTLTLNGAVNFNYTTVTHTDGSFSETTVTRMEKKLPNIKGNFSATYAFDRYTVTGKVRLYGPWTDITGNSATTGDLYQRFGTMAFFDLSATAQLTSRISVVAGAENLFNFYPARAVYQASRGLKYSRNAPYDTDGGQYFLRFNVKY